MKIRFRRSEILLIVYFAYTSVLACTLQLRAPIPIVTVGINVLIFAGLLLLAAVEGQGGSALLLGLRGFFPLPLVLLAYREMGWFAQPMGSHDLENSWIALDRVVLPVIQPAIEFFGLLIPSVLEMAYSLASPTPLVAVILLTAMKRQDRLDAFWFSFLLGAFMSYSLFPYFPSEPPRTIFPLDNVPGFNTIFRQFNFDMLSGYGIHTSVFPSAHVSAEFGAAIGLWSALPNRRWLWGSFLVLACLITVATVYGRYHYVVDALAGLAVSGVTLGITLCQKKWWKPV